MGFVGFIALGLMRGWGPTAASAAQVVYDTGFAYTLSVVPLFILMGNFVAKAGLAHELFRAAYAFIGHVRGGLAHATVLACAGFGGIAAGLPAAVAGMGELVRTGSMNALVALLIVVLVVLVTAAVVFVERGQRKITVNYAKRQVGNRVYGGQTSHLPLKLNMAGVIPPIFASSIILFPATLAQWFTSGDTSNPFVRALKDLAATLSPGQPVYILLYAAAIIFFCFFYTALVFNSRDTAENLKKSGAFVPGIRPGEQTARYIDKILMRLTLAGAIYISAVCLLPELLVLKWNVPFYFGGTSLLIIVVVTMDFMSQVQAYVMSHQYESLMKKANPKGVGA